MVESGATSTGQWAMDEVDKSLRRYCPKEEMDKSWRREKRKEEAMDEWCIRECGREESQWAKSSGQ